MNQHPYQKREQIRQNPIIIRSLHLYRSHALLRCLELNQKHLASILITMTDQPHFLLPQVISKIPRREPESSPAAHHPTLIRSLLSLHHPYISRTRQMKPQRMKQRRSISMRRKTITNHCRYREYTA